MQQRRTAPNRSPLVESLENRTMLAATPMTTTTIKVSTTAAVVGQSVTVSAAVKGSKHSGKLTGVFEFFDNGNPIVAAGNTLTVPMKHGKAKYVFGAGDVALFDGTHQITAEFLSSNEGLDSTSAAHTVTVSIPTLTTASDGLSMVTFGKGKGKPIKNGQKATVAYTGFLASDGTIFDYASAHKPANFAFVLGTGSAIQGFDEGTVGMRVGQTRVLDIPSALGYGASGQGSIPPDAELVFLVTLEKISKR